MKRFGSLVLLVLIVGLLVSLTSPHDQSVQQVYGAENQRVWISSWIPWNSTGVDLEVGQTVEINAYGSVNCGYQGCDFGPDGWTNYPPAPEGFVAPGLTYYALVGKIGISGTPFLLEVVIAVRSIITGPYI